ncbi:MAG: glycosyltransferase family 4 protein [Ardenticatenaceae bacterium]|nr:glycosyltransferase family 4 protein [Ardenticatenaceae bacterium]
MRVLMVTNKWPTAARPNEVPFLVAQAASLQAAGVEVTRFTFRGYRNPLNYGQAWLRLRRTHSLAQYDVVHAQFGQCGLLGLPVRRPLVVTYHGSDLQGDVAADGRYTRPGRVMQRVSQFVARQATANIVVSEHLRAFLPPTRRPAAVIPCGVDLNLFRPLPKAEARARLGLPAGARLVLFAANPSRPVKRYALAQAAVDALPASDRAVLVTVGDAPYDQMPIYMNACDVLLLTSSHEGSPTVVKEALACNLPVVAVPVGDVRQLLAAVAGCIVCADDAVATIAAGLHQVLQDGPAVAGREHVQQLDEAVIARRIIAVYESVL